jgi:alpha-glucosidase
MDRLDNPAWWQHGVVYQVYPRSFQDTNGDGIGDLNGIAARLDHLVALGVDAVWLSPIFTSPMADFGYDVANFYDIDPIFGTLADFDRLLAAAHARGIRVILDYVPNHTSDWHPWFEDSRSSRSSVRRDWYIWRDPAPHGGPPNNWLSEFGGSAWTFDPASGQYYYHAYLKEQPDLNWRNPEVRAAMLDVLRFWLDRGVDGFRVDAIHHLMEDPLLRDNPINPDWQRGMSPARSLIRAYTMDQSETHDAIAAMRRVVEEYDSRVLIGEVSLPIERLVAYYGADLGGFHLPFNFHLLSTPWRATAIAALVEAYEAALPPGGWPNWVLGNHDKRRVATRVGQHQARVAAMLLCTLRGTPTIYQGEEIGMTDVPLEPHQIRDPWGLQVGGFSRDPSRTPMPWTASANGGFTTGQPWLPLGNDVETRNVDVQSRDPNSLLSLYRALLRLRRSEHALAVGSYMTVEVTESLFVYERRYRDRRFLVALNLSDRPQRPDLDVQNLRRMLSTEHPSAAPDRPPAELPPHEGWILEA